MEKLATIVVPCLNSRDTLERLLRALDAQTLRDSLEILVVDNGSHDGSLEVARELADDIAVAPSRGAAWARNLGLELTRTAFMLTLDSDCQPVGPDWAARHLDALSNAPADAIATTGEVLPFPTADWWANRPEITAHAAFVDDRPAYALGSNGCYRTEVVAEVGGFPNFGADDAALGVYARRAGFHFLWTTGAAVYHANPEGWRQYYRHLRKIGQYAAEVDGQPDSLSRYLAAQARHWVSLVLASRSVREAFAGSLKIAAQTSGALETWRNGATLDRGSTPQPLPRRTDPS